MNKRVALCCAGELRNGRVFMNNQKHYLVDYYKSLGYIVDFYLYTNTYTTQRITNNNSELTWKSESIDKNRILEYYNILSNDCDIKKIVILEEETNTNTNGLYKQLSNIISVLNLVYETNIIYDIIVKYRPDLYFNMYPNNLQFDDEVIESLNPPYHLVDTIQIFNGKYLKNVIDGLISSKPIVINHTSIIFENIIINVLFNARLSITPQNRLCTLWRGTDNIYVKYMNLKYLNDFIHQEHIPVYNINTLIDISNLCDKYKHNNITIKLTLNNLNNIDNIINFYDYCSITDSIEYQKMLLLAFQSNIIYCNESNILYNFIKTEFKNTTIISDNT